MFIFCILLFFTTTTIALHAMGDMFQDNFFTVIKYYGITSVKKLLAGGSPYINIRNEDGNTPLMLAIINDQSPLIIKLLLEHGAHVNVADPNGWTPLIYAINRGNIPTIKLLIEQKADVNVFTKIKRWTPLIFAISNKQIEVIKLLIEQGALVNVITNTNDTPLSMVRFLELYKILYYFTQKEYKNSQQQYIIQSLNSPFVQEYSKWLSLPEDEKYSLQEQEELYSMHIARIHNSLDKQPKTIFKYSNSLQPLLNDRTTVFPTNISILTNN